MLSVAFKPCSFSRIASKAFTLVNGFEKPTLDGGVDQRYRMVQVC
jgi:hypothetical protein